jgi:hypothetical protein
VAPEDPKQIVGEAYALAEGKALPYIATLTGEITEIGTYNETYGDITLKIVVFGKEFECYALKGENVQALQVGDIITVTGTIKNYYGKIEFDKPTLDSVGAPVVGMTVSGAVVTGADGDTTIELLNGEEVVATVTASGKEGTYSIENVAAGTYTLKVSKENHVTREYTITVGTEALTQDVKIHLIGDIDGSGSVNMGDISIMYAHIKGTKQLTEDYQVLVANVNGSSLNMGDFSTLYAHITGNKKLY